MLESSHKNFKEDTSTYIFNVMKEKHSYCVKFRKSHQKILKDKTKNKNSRKIQYLRKTFFG